VGGGKAKAHESFAVAPTSSAVDHPGYSADDVGDGASGGLYVVQSDDLPEETVDGGFEDPVAAVGQAKDFDGLKEAVAQASQALDEAAAQGMPAQLIADANKELHQATATWLGELPPEKLAELAAANGFEHPSLVGLNSDKGTHPLVHWLDPSYPSDVPSKAKIQAKAAERYAALAGGGTINGLTLADVKAAEANLPVGDPPGDGWAASAGEVVAAQAALSDAVVAYNTTFDVKGKAAALKTMIDAENHLATASCPQLGADLEAAKGSARGAVDAALGTPPWQMKDPIHSMTAEAIEAGTVPPGTDSFSSTNEALKLMRTSTPAAERAALVDQVEQRQGQWAKFQELRDQYKLHYPSNAGGGLLLEGVTTPAGQAELAAFANTAGSLGQVRKEIFGWSSSAMGYPELSTAGLYTADQSSLTSNFKAWSKEQPLGGLRDTATAMGLPAGDAAVATRGQVQNYIAGSWDHTINKGSLSAGVGAGEAKAAKVAAAHAAKAAAKASWVAPQSQVGAGAVPAAAPGVAVPGAGSKPASLATAPPPGKVTAGSFGAKQKALVEALRHHTASVGSLPPRPSAAEVDSWEFTPAKGPQLGGQHSKTFWHPPGQQSVWMFKGDQHNNGARAEGEAAASRVYAQVGVPSVPVYARSVGGKTGVIQPLLQGATNLSSSPKSWSQADVDALVRSHVAAHAVGDHDAKADNQLRTAAGGLVPCDHGCAFRDFGSDKLSTSYQPRCVTVHQQLYQAGKTGGLAKGVKVRPEAALPVIKAFEAIPDSQYRAMLHNTAYSGAKQKVTWYPAMRARASARHATATPSDHQVAEEFLDYAVARKSGLRKAFADFFSHEGFASGANLEKVA
jgi:hypothetical protein